MTRLAITSAVCLGPWGDETSQLDGLNWQEAGPTDAPPVPGFIESAFNPLVYAVIRRLFDLEAFSAGEQTSLLLGSLFGDATTNDLASKQLIQGKPDNPLLFYQSVMNSIVGYITREMGITGTTLCTTSFGNMTSALLEQAELLLASGDARQVIIVGAEVSGSVKTDKTWSLLDPSGTRHGMIVDAAAAFVVEREEDASAAGRPILAVLELAGSGVSGCPETASSTYEALPLRLGGIQGMIGLALALQRLGSSPASASVLFRDYSIGGEPHEIQLAISAGLG